uniref:Caspase-8 n=1 Tax=Phasianus colchicus TaxID=9054 RepID=A0A669Q1Y4_PHACC
MEVVDSLQFRQLLLLIDEKLGAEDVAALKFLCTDLIPFRKLERVQSAMDIFQLLIDEGYLNEEDTFLLAELLYRIKYHSLLSLLGYTKEKVRECLREKGRVSPYRTINVVFFLNLLYQSALELLILLEKQGLLTENNVQILEEVLKNVSPDLLETVNCYRMANGELERVFKWLGLDVRTYTDQTSDQIKELMQAWQSSEDHKDRDCFVCCILSHGESGAVYGKDGKLVSIRTIMTYFTAKKCPQLTEKPKLFFIQACQGKEIQRPVCVETDARVPNFSSVQQSISPSESIPEEADFLLGMATIDGYASFRHVQEGTWYIQALCSKLQLLVPRGEDILSILTEVNEDVSKRVDRCGTRKQMPQPAYTLRRRLIFPIPRDPPPSQRHQDF